MKHLRITALAAALIIALGAQAQDAVRPEVGKPLQAAQELIKGGKYKEALAKVREADAVSSKADHWRDGKEFHNHSKGIP